MPIKSSSGRGLPDPYGGSSSRMTVPSALQFDQTSADLQQILRQYNTTEATAASYAGSRALSAQESALKEWERLRILKEAGAAIPQDRLDELYSIAYPSNLEKVFGAVAENKVGGGLFKLLDVVSRPFQGIQLALIDLFGGDAKYGKEIKGGDYLDLFMGRREELVENLGTQVVGEGGGISASVMLDMLGWEKTDNTFNKIARFGGQFLGELATDPLTYVTGGASGLSKAVRARHLARTSDKVIDVVKLALEAGDSAAIRQVDNLGDNFGRAVFDHADTARRAIDDEVREKVFESVRTKTDIDGVLENFTTLTLDDLDLIGGGVIDEDVIGRFIDNDILNRYAIDKASLEAGDRTFNQSVQALLNKDFANDTLRNMSQAFGGNKVLEGGLRVTVPFARSKPHGSWVVPGTVGKGKALRETVLGHTAAYRGTEKGALGLLDRSKLFQRSTDWVRKLDRDVLMKAIGQGGFVGKERQLVRLMDNMATVAADHADFSGMRDLVGRHNDLYAEMKKAGMSDKEQLLLRRSVGRIQEMTGGTADNLLNDIRNLTEGGDAVAAKVTPGVVDAVDAWKTQLQGTLEYVFRAAKEVGVIDGDLEHYAPHMLTSGAQELLDELIKLGRVPTGDNWADQMVRALVEARRRAQTIDETVVGEAQAGSERLLGKTVSVGTGDPIIPRVIGDSVITDSRAFAAKDMTIAELNDAIRESVEQLDDPRLSRFLETRDGGPFAMYNDDPFETLNAYAHDVLMAVQQREIINRMQDLGLVDDAATYVNQQMLARQIQSKLGKYGPDVMGRAEEQMGRIIDSKMDVVRSAREGTLELEGDLVVAGRVGDVEIRVPRSVVEGNKRLAAKLEKLKDSRTKATVILERARIIHDEVYNAARRAGVDNTTATNIAAATSKKELHSILKDVRGAVQRQVRDEMSVYRTAVATSKDDLGNLAAVQEKLSAKVAAYDAEIAQRMASVERSIRDLSGKTVHRVRHEPFGDVSGVALLRTQMEITMVEDLNAMGAAFRATGDIEAAGMVEAIAQVVQTGAATDLQALGRDVGNVVRTVIDGHRARLDWLAQVDESTVAWASNRFLDQAVWYEGNALDVGNWAGKIDNPRWVFHGTNVPHMGHLGQARNWSGAGMTVNPVRASRYADDGWVLVWDTNTMSPTVADNFRSGIDVESRNQLNMLLGADEAATLPPPAAVIPASALREALSRKAGLDPDQLTALSRSEFSNAFHDVFSRAPEEALPDISSTRLRRLADDAIADPTYTGTAAYKRRVRSILEDAGASRQEADNVASRYAELLQRHREYQAKGMVDEAVAKPFDVRTEKTRQAAISAWRDTWADRAAKGIPTREVGEPVTAPWVSSTTHINGVDSYMDMLDQLSDRRVAQLTAETAEGSFDFEQLQVAVDQFWQREFLDWKNGNPSPAMQDVHAASQRSLLARGLGDEVEVWTIPDGQLNSNGLQQVSLTPLPGSRPMTIARERIALDMGALLPQDLNLLDDAARKVRNSVMVDAGDLTITAGETVEQLTKRFPSKGQLHNMQPRNFTMQRMLSYFGDAKVAEDAYADLVRRFDLLGPAHPETVAKLAQAENHGSTWFNMTRGNGDRIGILENVENVYRNPAEYGRMFEDPDVQEWFTRNAARAGYDVEFKQATLVPGERSYRVGLKGDPDGVQATIPVYVHHDVEQLSTMTRFSMETELRRLGVTASESRSKALLASQGHNMSDEVFAALSVEERQRVRAAMKFFDDADERLYNTVLGLDNEVVSSFDRAQRLAAQKSALSRGRRNFSEAQLGAKGRYTQRHVREQTREGLDIAKAEAAGNPKEFGFTISPTSGRLPTEGFSIGTGYGYQAFKAASPAEALELFDAELDTWLRANHGNLTRTNAHVGGWWDDGALHVEISLVTDSRARAHKMGIELDQVAIQDLARNETLSLPPSQRQVTKLQRAAARKTETEEILDEVGKYVDSGDLVAAETILRDSHNYQVVAREIGFDETSDMIEQLALERYLKDPITPGKPAMAATAKARRLLGDPDAAVKTAYEFREETLRELAAEQSADVAELLQGKARFAEIMADIMGVGYSDDLGRLLDPSLYPADEVGRITVERSKQKIAMVKEAQQIAERSGWKDISDALEEVWKDPPLAIMAEARGPGPAQHSFAVYGIGGRITDYKVASRDAAFAIESMVSRFQTLTTPPGFELLAKQSKWIARAWKSMATVSRVNFHPRNLIGGVWNNQVADVRYADYVWTGATGNKLRRLQESGASLDDMARAFGDDWEVINAARRAGIFGEGFAAGDLEYVGRKAKIQQGKVWNPGDAAFLPTRAGGYAMRSIEDFLRLSAFRRWYDELGAEGARDIVNMVHFNYSDLSRMEQKIKRFVPFYVWSRNNIPLQVKLLVERPDIAQRYVHMMNAVNDNFGDDDNWAGNAFANPMAAELGVKIGGDEHWAKLVFDPDLPITDLAQFAGNPLNPATYLNGIINMAGPHISMPLQYSEQNEWGSTNAPVGFNAILRALDMVNPWYNPTVSAQGDVQVGYGTRNTLNTLLPILGEYSQLTGTVNNPEQLQRIGIDTTDGVQVGERALGALTFLGRGLGITAKTPNDTRVAAYQAEQRVREILDELKLQNVVQPSDFESNQKIIAQARAAGLLPTP